MKVNIYSTPLFFEALALPNDVAEVTFGVTNLSEALTKSFSLAADVSFWNQPKFNRAVVKGGSRILVLKEDSESNQPHILLLHLGRETREIFPLFKKFQEEKDLDIFRQFIFMPIS